MPIFIRGKINLINHSAAECRPPGASAAHAAELRRLQRECQQLRDRNDELCAALETHARGAAPEEEGTESARGGDLSTELHSFLSHEHSEECDSSPVSLDQKISGHVDAVAKLREICESVRGIPSPADCPHCGDVASAVRRLQQRRSNARPACLDSRPTGFSRENVPLCVLNGSSTSSTASSSGDIPITTGQCEQGKCRATLSH
uniref:Uncharacterized protein n=1 Tax=Heliothis virescens TaxID=7102 RepID=A0A2A4K0V2_HELVI